MSLKKRAIEGIVVAGSLVMMSTIAQAADLDGVQVRTQRYRQRRTSLQGEQQELLPG